MTLSWWGQTSQRSLDSGCMYMYSRHHKKVTVPFVLHREWKQWKNSNKNSVKTVCKKLWQSIPMEKRLDRLDRLKKNWHTRSKISQATRVGTTLKKQPREGAFQKFWTESAVPLQATNTTRGAGASYISRATLNGCGNDIHCHNYLYSSLSPCLISSTRVLLTRTCVGMSNDPK